MKDRITVFLVDDSRLVREGLRLMLEDCGFAVVGEADSIQGTLDHPSLSLAQVVVLDITLKEASGIDLIPSLCGRGIRVVVYSIHEESSVVRCALKAGAAGFVTKREAAQSLPEAIRAVVAGAKYVSPRATV